MALFKYFSMAKAGSSSNHETERKVREAKKEPTEVKKIKRGKYTRLSQEEKATIARYACENGLSAALTYFKDKC